MKVLGIVAEFNPFHNGHKYLIEEAKKQTGAEACIIVMSGNFVQRGEVALMDKFSRARIAVSNGVDIVIELPAHISTASAEGFAFGAVSLLHQLNIVDSIAFGAETDNFELLDTISGLLLNETDEFKLQIKKLCEEGNSYPLARTKAIIDTLPDNIKDEAFEALNSPNSILAIEYLKALKRLNSEITPVPILRIGSGYNDTSFSNFSSATGIRQFLRNENNINECVPEQAHEQMKTYSTDRGFIFEEDIFPALINKLMTSDKDELCNYLDSNEFIANRILKNIYNIKSYEDLISTLSSKDYTLSRIKRVLVHILLGLDKSILSNNDYKDYEAGYARVLACNNEKLLSQLCKNAEIPVIVKASSQIELLDEINRKHFENDLRANNIYQGIITAKYNRIPLNEFQQNIFPDKTNG